MNIDELLGRPVSMRALALLRVLMGPIVLLHLRPFLVDAMHGVIYRDHFYEPYAAWYPELPRVMYIGVLVAGAGAAAAMSLGLWARVATATTFGIVTYNVFLSTTHFHSNRAYLIIVLGVLMVSRCDRELAVDVWLRQRRGRARRDTSAPAWPLWLLRFEAATVYGASGLSKLLDPDWFGGTVSWQRMLQVQDRLRSSALPDWVVSVLTNRTFHVGAAKVIIATELFVAFGLWWRSTRYAAVWLAVCFHAAIQVSASVQVFSYLGIAALAIWAVPSTRDRVLLVDVHQAGHWRLVRVVRALDWLARFRIEPTAAPGNPITVLDRDGTVATGRTAVFLTLSRLPLTAWFFLPMVALGGRRRSPTTPETLVIAR